jgi:CHAT domain-containing protein
MHIPAVLLAVLLAPHAAIDDVSVRTARIAVARAYHGNFAAFAGAKGTDVFERQLRNAQRVHCLRPEIVVTRVERAESDAVVEMDVAAWNRDPEIAAVRVRMTPRGEGWRIDAVELPDEEAADRLIASGDPRDATKAIGRIVFLRALDLSVTAKPAVATPVAKLAREIAVFNGDRAGEAMAISVDSAVARKLGDRDRALLLARESLAIAEESGNAEALSRAWSLLGKTLEQFDQHSGEPDECYRRAIVFAEKAEDPRLLIRPLHNLSASAYVESDFLTARTLLERTRPLMAYAGDPQSEILFDMQLALIYGAQGDHEQSLHHGTRARDLAKKHGSWVYPYALTRNAATLQAEGHHDEARRTLEEARAHTLPNDHSLGAVHLDLAAMLAADAGDFDEAECLLREAARRYGQAAYAYGPMFDIVTTKLAEQGRHTTALRLSLEQATTRQQGGALVNALAGAASAYRALGLREPAKKAIREAIDLREAMHGQVSGGDEQKILSGEQTAECYELAADLAIDDGNAEEALALIERGRGRVLYDIVRGGKASDAETEQADKLERTRHETALAKLNVDLERAAAGGDRARETRLRAELETARRDYQTFLDGLRARYDRRGTSAIPIDAATLRRDFARLPRGLAVVEYAVRDEQLQAFVVRQDRVTVRTIAIDRETLQKRVDELADMLATRNLRYRTAAAALYELLIAPLETELASSESLCFVPDEMLWRLPFAALVDEQGRFLVERAAVVYAPSISIYAAMSGAGAPRNAARVLALGNPTLDPDTRRELTSFYRGVSLGALPDAEREVGALCAIYGAADCTILTGGAATESGVRSAIGDARLVHFATHGVLDDRNPMYSRLVLARGAGAADDGSLEAWEIARLRIDADLVVLSACETARGRIGGGEGVVGIAWSFFVAGARSTVATLWKVGSERSADLMISFHESLRARANDSALGKAHALRDAQLRLLRDGDTQHPFHWAAFVILGDAS